MRLSLSILGTEVLRINTGPQWEIVEDGEVWVDNTGAALEFVADDEDEVEDRTFGFGRS